MRAAAAASALAVLAVLLGQALLELPGSGQVLTRYGALVAARALEDTHAQNLVAAVVFDYRALDTLLEELILFTAAAGASLLLREHEPEVGGPIHEVPGPSEAVRLGALVGMVPTLLLGGVMLAHGHLTPGGGFQGGVVIGSALALGWLAADFRTYARLVDPATAHVVEALAVAAFVAVGLVGLGQGALLEQVLPLGVPGHLLSSGNILLLNVVTGIAVAAVTARLVAEFLEQALEED